ncbi:hypothetical protein BS50DRAFT_15280 [Corynespora cassiicola Philippines]|uniref:Uncharacterized protein n=1 Tax=Corynespora cassiicola Philippines TaxID=1448308 RepID=A0A2T2P9T0_CORCC|nr:hypothetical protein BS50DRAFT_15280 [Corynespora cassiicola Philippines]
MLEGIVPSKALSSFCSCHPPSFSHPSSSLPARCLARPSGDKTEAVRILWAAKFQRVCLVILLPIPSSRRWPWGCNEVPNSFLRGFDVDRIRVRRGPLTNEIPGPSQATDPAYLPVCPPLRPRLCHTAAPPPHPATCTHTRTRTRARTRIPSPYHQRVMASGWPGRPRIETSWVFPAPLNATLIQSGAPNALAEAYHGYESTSTPALMMWAALNMTYSQRVETGHDARGFGGFGEYAGLGGDDETETVIRVGDVITPVWTAEGRGNRSVEMSCMVCSRGIEEGSMRGACDDYTDAARITSFLDTEDNMGSGTPYTIPDLSLFFDMHERASAICILGLSSPSDTRHHDDLSIPFPVLQQSRTPPAHHFNASSPRGIPEPAIEPAASAPTVVFTATAGQSGSSPGASEDGGGGGGGDDNDDDELGVGVIVGVVIGAMCFTLLAVAGAWFLWRRRRKGKGKKNTGSSASSVVGNADAGRVTSGGMGGEEALRLQSVPPVVRRPASSHEVPPAYHEIFKDIRVDSR